jgi:hypothetical protein
VSQTTSCGGTNGSFTIAEDNMSVAMRHKAARNLDETLGASPYFKPCLSFATPSITSKLNKVSVDL